MPDPEPLIPPHGGYRKLKSYQIAELVYDLTVKFCDRFIDKRSRTHDQMVQAARSGVQNIVEGSVDSGTSKKIELKLTGIARGSLEELRKDYEAFLRQRELEIWPTGDLRRASLIAARPKTIRDIGAWIKAHKENSTARAGEVEANAVLTLVVVACKLLDNQIQAQARQFEAEGGFTERIYRTRRAQRTQQTNSTPSTQSTKSTKST
jgi:four helix bundle suffix protein